jgi:hypothetical protein
MLMAVRDLLSANGFLIGFAVSVAVAVVLVLAGRVGNFAIVAGIPAIAGSMAGFAAEHRWSWPMVAGILLLAVGAEASRRRPVFVLLAAMIPGAALLSVALPSRVPGWATPVSLAATVVVALLTVDVDVALPRLSTPLLCITALGVYAAVPDTEYARALFGALLGASLLAARSALRARPGAAAALAGLFVWSCIAGGYARPASVVGALGCIGMIAITPVTTRLTRSMTQSRRTVVAIVVLQLALAVVCSRGAARTDSVPASLAIVAVSWTMAALAFTRVIGNAGSASRRPDTTH